MKESSARVSFSQACTKVDGSSNGEASNADEDDDGDGAQSGGITGVVEAAVSPGRPCYPLFVDGIADSVEYSQIRDLFSQHGRMRNVFVQRKRRCGRKFRFGFVRYVKKEDAVRALELLDGVRLGGAYLSVKPEISAGKVGRRRRRDIEVAPAMAFDALAQKNQLAPRGPSPAFRSWSDVVKRGSMERLSNVPAWDSEFLFDGVGGYGLWPQRISDEVLFPESAGSCKVGGGAVRLSDEELFPELLPCSGREASLPLVAVGAGASDVGEPQMVEVVEAGWAHAVVPSVTDVACAFLDGDAQMVEHEEAGWAWLQRLQCWATHDILSTFNLVDPFRLEFSFCCFHFRMGSLNFKLPLGAPLGSRSNFIPWINDYLLQLRGFSFAALQENSTTVCATDDMLVAREGAREDGDDRIGYVFDVGSLSFEGFGSFPPTHSSFESGECSVNGLDTARGASDGSEAYSISVRGEVTSEDGDAVFVDDPSLDFTPPRPRPRGRPKKSRGAKLSRGSSRRPRGRPRIAERVTIDIAPAPSSPPSPSGPYFTRAKKAWSLAKFSGMSFPGSDDDAIRGLAEVIKENFPSLC